MKYGSVVLLTIIVLVAITGFSAADRLPNQTPENQVFSVDTVIDATGSVDAATRLAWVIATPGAIPTGVIDSRIDSGNGVFRINSIDGHTIADALYQDSILTNGGKLSENKNFDFNSKDQTDGLYNIESQKVLTYASTEGAHMVGEEEYTLSVAGEAKNATDNIRCVFSTDHGSWLPPFCNIVSAKSNLVNINSAQISTEGQLRAVAETSDIPAEVNYQIAVTPDANSGSGFAEGTVSTMYAGSIMEGRDTGLYRTSTDTIVLNAQTYNSRGLYIFDPRVLGQDIYGHSVEYDPSATNTWKDGTTATGGIKNFQKAFAYKSGFKI